MPKKVIHPTLFIASHCLACIAPIYIRNVIVSAGVALLGCYLITVYYRLLSGQRRYLSELKELSAVVKFTSSRSRHTSDVIALICTISCVLSCFNDYEYAVSTAIVKAIVLIPILIYMFVVEARILKDHSFDEAAAKSAAHYERFLALVSMPKFQPFYQRHPSWFLSLYHKAVQNARICASVRDVKRNSSSWGAVAISGVLTRVGLSGIILQPSPTMRTEACLRLASWFIPLRRREEMLSDLAEMVNRSRACGLGELRIRLLLIYHLGLPVLSPLIKFILLFKW